MTGDHVRPYSGRVLRVDLTNGTITVEERDDTFYRRYLGGWGFIGHCLLHEVPPGTDPLGPANRLVFATGVVSGLPFSGAARHAVGAKSPLTGGFGGSEVGGFWGTELKRAGFDAIIVEGRAEKPVYLWVHDGEAEIRDAGDLWGLETKVVQERLQEALGDKRIRVAQIGPGGENMVRYACLMNDLKDAAGRTGMGAVMGSKNLKAIALRGAGKIQAVHPDKIQELARWMGARVEELSYGHHTFGTGGAMPAFEATGNLPVHNFRDGGFAADKISAGTIKETISIGMEGCFACAVQCKKVVQMDEPYIVDPAYGGPEYETIGAIGSACGIDDLGAIARGSALCNAYTIDTISTGMTIACAMECFEAGLLTLEDTGGVDLRFGNAEAMLTMIEQIAYREGFGDRLAEGSKRLVASLGPEAEKYAIQVKGQEFPMHEPRLKRALAIGYAVSPTGADHNHSLHDMGLEAEGPMLDRMKEVGILEPVPLESLGPDKVRMAWVHTLDQMSQNSALVCNFVQWTFSQRVEAVRAATGWDFTLYEWLKCGERALSMSRLFNAREGFTAADDWLPSRMFEPPTSGPLADTAIDPGDLGDALGTFYRMAGWDLETGCPTSGRLKELDMEWALAYLPPAVE